MEMIKRILGTQSPMDCFLRQEKYRERERETEH